jgi:cystathionine beta-lyase
MSGLTKTGLTQDDVISLVREFLSESGLTETEDALSREAFKLHRKRKSQSRLTDLLEKSYVTELASGSMLQKRVKRNHLDGNALERSSGVLSAEPSAQSEVSIDTQIISYQPKHKDPHGASVMPIYQTSTFAQPGAADFGEYDYTRSGNPTRDALQDQIAELDGGARCFCFTTGMAAITAVTRVVKAAEEVIVNDDSYGGTYRLMSKVATQHGIRVRYVNMAGRCGPQNLKEALTSDTRLVMIESPTNPMQRICDIRALAKVCHANDHVHGTLLSIDNTMMSPVLSRPLEYGADIVIHSATKFMCGHSDTMAGAVVVADRKDGRDNVKQLSESIYFYQNAEGTALAPFDCWLVSRGLKTMALRVRAQQENAVQVVTFLKMCPQIQRVIYAGDEDFLDSDIHLQQASGGGSVVCFTTGSVALSEHIVTATKLFKITVSFGSVNSLISMPGRMSHASIPDDVKAAREFPEDLVRMSIGIESPGDLIEDLKQAVTSYSVQSV